MQSQFLTFKTLIFVAINLKKVASATLWSNQYGCSEIPWLSYAAPVWFIPRCDMCWSVSGCCGTTYGPVKVKHDLISSGFVATDEGERMRPSPDQNQVQHRNQHHAAFVPLGFDPEGPNAKFSLRVSSEFHTVPLCVDKKKDGRIRDASTAILCRGHVKRIPAQS